MNKFITIFFILFIICQSIMPKENILKPKLKANNLLEKRIKIWISELDKENHKIFFQNLELIGEVCVPYLTETLKNKSFNIKIRERALLIIASIEPISCYNLLIDVLQDDKENLELRLLAISLLENIEKAEVFKILSKYSQSGNEKISKTASYSLLKFNNMEAIPYLITLLKHWDRDILQKTYVLLVKLTGKYEIDMNYESWSRWWSNYKDIFQGLK